MKVLASNWLTEGIIDFEYKKYILLDYLQDVKDNFSHFKLYPFLGDLVNHYEQLNSLSEGKKNLGEDWKTNISGIDLQNFVLEYKAKEEGSKLLDEIDDIVSFAIPQIRSSLNEGKQRYDEVESNLSIYPIGIVPNYKDEGFILLSDNLGKTFVYRYQLSMIELLKERYRSVKTSFVKKYDLSLVNNYYAIRNDIIEKYNEFDSPSTIVIESKLQVPIKETFLPVAKRSLLKYFLEIN